MDNGYSNESMLDLFLYETAHNIEQLEAAILSSEKAGCFSTDAVNEIFRVMHTIKGSSAMMVYNSISSLSHAIEDMFYFIREESPENLNFAHISDLVLEGADFIKLEMEKLKNSDPLDGDPTALIAELKSYLLEMQGKAPAAEEPELEKTSAPAELEGEGALYEAVMFFEEGCEMENLRAFAIVHHFKDLCESLHHFPEDIVENVDSVRIIREQGFRITFKSRRPMRELHDFLASSAFVRSLELNELKEEAPAQKQSVNNAQEATAALNKLRQPQENGLTEGRASHQSIISVDVLKLDRLMDLMGEMVIAEAMVTQNPELQAVQLNGFHKAARQLRKITSEMQDMVMSIRMVPLSATFHKMHRIVRDMGRKLNKEVELILIGEATEVDKNIIEHISDPLMHLVRNAVDHGIEQPDARETKGKPRRGQVVLEAKNAGSDVIVTVRDDGNGLNKEKILKRARENGLLTKPESEMTDREIYSLVLLPGFSTSESVTEFSGRGVGMDVVTRNLESVGGSVAMDSAEGVGTLATMKIPLTLAIIDGMSIRVGNATYTLPTTSIQETFQAKEKDLFEDPEGNELIMVRGSCYRVCRLHKAFNMKTEVTDLTKGIMLMIEQDGKSVCLFADDLLGQHQVVVKALPSYLKKLRRLENLAGCTLLGDGSISLILNIGGLINLE